MSKYEFAPAITREVAVNVFNKAVTLLNEYNEDMDAFEKYWRTSDFRELAKPLENLTREERAASWDHYRRSSCEVPVIRPGASEEQQIVFYMFMGAFDVLGYKEVAHTMPYSFYEE